MSKIHHSPKADVLDALSGFDGDAPAYRRLFEAVAGRIPFSQAVLVSTFPRGGTQLIQPMQMPDGFSRAYSKGLFTCDGPTWQALLKNRPVTGKDCVASGSLDSSEYYRKMMEPHGLAYVAAVRLPSPILRGYPGALHLYRRAEEPAFSSEDLKNLGHLAAQIGPIIDSARESRVLDTCGPQLPWEYANNCRQFIFDRKGRQVALFDKKSVLDDQLKSAIRDLVAGRLEAVNGEAVVSDRVELPDSHGEKWAFRTVVHRTFPALGDGPYVFLCIQPPACEWNAIRVGDIQADAEVSRLVPSLKFMQAEFHRVPTLNEIASKSHLSPFHFHRRFTELLGLTPKHFLLSCQITQAKRMLMERRITLAEISAECGFAHQSHFTSRFKQATGLTPTRWRRYATENFSVAAAVKSS